jgi:type I restriction enzyme S subunit
MQRYEKYKDSGVDWIGEIPEHWKMLSNKYIFNLKKNQVGKKSAEYELLSLTLKGIIKRDMENPEGKFPAEFDTYQEVKKGDFIFCLFDVEETPRTVGLSDFDGMITGAYTVFNVTEKADKRFLYYFYLNLDEKKRLKFLYRGLRNTIPKDSFFTFKTAFPPISEQHLIASFLDNKTAKIDQTIAIKEKEIELLKERRQILIQKAVTKGLDDTVTLKDSGVDWIGEIPDHWEVRKLKFHTSKIGSGVTPSGGATTYLDEGIPLLRSQNVYFDRFEFENVAYISEKTHNEMSNSKVQQNDILLNITGGSIGRCNIFKYNFEANVNQHVCIVRPKNIIPNYLNSLLSSSLGQFQVFFQQQGGGREGLNFQNLKNFYFPIAPLAEQTNIVSYLEKIEEKIAKAILLKQQEIEKLKEYKTVLIDNVVTGKVRVS